MKKIPNLTFQLKLNQGSDEQATTAKLIGLVLQQPPQGGFDFSTMRARTRVATAVEKAAVGGEIELEDADFATAVQCVQAYRWGANHPDLIKFAEQFGL